MVKASQPSDWPPPTSRPDDIYVAAPFDQRPVRALVRVWREGCEPIALFIDHPGDMDPHHCSSYVRAGGHGAANPRTMMQATRPPRACELARFVRELNRIGYVIHLYKRIPKDAYDVRAAELANYR